MTRRARALAALGLALAGCVAPRADVARVLPANRDAPVVYVALGDSTVEGVGATSAAANYVSRLGERLRLAYPRASTVNLGVGGARSADVLSGQLWRGIALRPALVTISIGPNDVTGRVSVGQYERNMDAILARLVESGAVVVVNLLPDLALTPRFRGREAEAVVGRRTIEFNAALARAGSRHGAEIVDLYAPSRTEVPRRPELIGADGYHPSDAGYARWAEFMWEGVRRRMPLPTE
ncbi:MAG: SGNH/GDSL hydrolase family protein [Candidatus Rokuibacteriota bacterium]